MYYYTFFKLLQVAEFSGANEASLRKLVVEHQ